MILFLNFNSQLHFSILRRHIFSLDQKIKLYEIILFFNINTWRNSVIFDGLVLFVKPKDKTIGNDFDFWILTYTKFHSFWGRFTFVCEAKQ